MLVDVVSKNGNLLIGIGPDEHGRIIAQQQEPLHGLGAWMKDNGKVIRGSRPWTQPATETTDGTGVRFVQQGGDVYAILLGLPGARTFALRGVDGRSVDAAHIVGSRAKVGIGERDGMVEITLPERVPVEPAYALHLGSGVRWNG